MVNPVEISEMQAEIDKALHYSLETLLVDYPAEFAHILNYQLGWEGENSGPAAQGKRIRPLLVLLACHACGGNWRKALPAAAAVELVHNFSLIHDDIQDCSDTRRGRQTVWVKWGQAQAINAGDAMLTVAQLSMFQLLTDFEHLIVNHAISILQNACLKLTRGQYLDIAFEKQNDLPMDLYWQMIEGKTGALLAACLGLGALAGGANEYLWQKFMDFGNKIGAAFQVQDDWLGIWGDGNLIGKSTISDLVAKKKTYPVLIGIQNRGDFYREWQSIEEISPENALKLANMLEKEGCNQSTARMYEKLYTQAFNQFNSLELERENVDPLLHAIRELFNRNK